MSEYARPDRLRPRGGMPYPDGRLQKTGLPLRARGGTGESIQYAATVLLAQLAFSAVAVPRGVHRAVWRERLAGGRFARWGPAFFVLFGGLALRGRRKGSDAERHRP